MKRVSKPRPMSKPSKIRKRSTESSGQPVPTESIPIPTKSAVTSGTMESAETSESKGAKGMKRKSASNIQLDGWKSITEEDSKKRKKIFRKQLNILLWKSFIIRRVHCCSTCCEVLGPILFYLFVMSAFRNSNLFNPQGNQTDTTTTQSPMQIDNLEPHHKVKRETTFTIGLDDTQSLEVPAVIYAPDNPSNKFLLRTMSHKSGHGDEKKLIKTLKDHARAPEQTCDPNNIGVFFKKNTKKMLDYQLYLGCSDWASLSAVDNCHKSIAIVSSNIMKQYANQIGIDPNKLPKSIPDIKNIQLKPITHSISKKTLSAETKPKDIVAIYYVIGPFLLITYILVVPVIVKRITDEKSNKSKELMKMMGMSDPVFWTAHFISNLIIGTMHGIALTFLFFTFGNRLFTSSSPLIIFIIFIMFYMQMILFAMTLSTIFNRPILAVMITIILWMTTSVWINSSYSPLVTNGNYDFKKPHIIMLYITSLLPMGSICWALSLAGILETEGTGLTFKTINISVQQFGSLTGLRIMLMMAISYPCYMFLIWYLDQVCPWQSGVPRHPCFFLNRKYWSEQQDVPVSNSSEQPIQQQQSDKQISIQAIDVTKIFNSSLCFKTGQGKVAVNHLNLSIYQDQLTVLLGHNGAGKSTLISMITGQFSPTSGKIIVDGYDMNSQTNQARQSIGLCPQENVIFPELTVYQHLKLFAGLKGVKVNCDQTLKRLKLLDKKNTKAKKLSGGMQRRLQLAMAMAGNPRIIILDEPTSGMDPEVRRMIWDYLISYRRQKTILLTTHYMEEADVCGDRIVIMSEGRIRCDGSPAFLKAQFGTGYKLNIDKASGFNSSKFTQWLTKRIPTAKLKSEIGKEVIYSLDEKQQQKQRLLDVFPQLLRDLEEHREKFGIQSFGLSYSTLEDVFLNVDAIVEDEKVLKKTEVQDDEESNELLLTPPSDMLKGPSLLASRFRGLLIKRVQCTLRHWQMLLFQVLVPSLMVILSMCLANTLLSQTVGSKSDTVTIVPYSRDSRVFYKGPPELKKIYQKVNSKSKIVKSLTEENEPPTHYGLEVDPSSNIYQVWYNDQKPDSILLSLKSLFEWYINTIKSAKIELSLKSVNIPQNVKPLKGESKNRSTNEKEDERVIVSLLTWGVMCLLLFPITFPFLAASYLLFPLHERVTKAKLLQLMTSVEPITFWICHFIFDLICHFITVTILFLVIFLFDTHSVLFNHNSLGTGLVLFLILMSFGFATIPFAYIFSLVFRSPGSGFVFLVVAFLVFGLITNLFMSIIDLLDNVFGVFNRTGNKVYWFERVIYIFRMIPIFSMLFGYQKLYKANILIQYCKNYNGLKQTCANFELQPKKLDLLKGCCTNICEKTKTCYDSGTFSFGPFGSGWEIVFMLVSGMFYFIFLLLIEHLGEFFRPIIDCINGIKSKIFKAKCKIFRKVEIDDDEDSDVTAEKLRIKQFKKKNSKINNVNVDDTFLVVKNLTKKFGSFTAVDHISFGISQGECFGLLGTNGAGKTTLFSMLTGDILPSGGEAFMVPNISLLKNFILFRKKTGYCPQYDALLELLTGEESLLLIGRLRGIPSANLYRDVWQLLNMTGLKKHANALVGNYSGGNKRKVAIAQALMGNPPLILLDEPTCGVDPGARRRIWKTLIRIKKFINSSMILTSHSMEESEALCSRMAIMVRGRFRCLGSTQHLRSKYGQGYTIVIRLKREFETNEEYINLVQSRISKVIPSVCLKDYYQCLLTYHSPDRSIKWSDMFDRMAKLNQELVFEDYVISDTTLESIFLKFAREKG